MQNFLLNIFITIVVCPIWLQLRARQAFLVYIHFYIYILHPYHLIT